VVTTEQRPVEIEPGRRRRPRSRVAVVVLTTVVLAPLLLLQLLPLVLGLDRFVMTSTDMGETVPRGSLVVSRTVPVGDLEAGDVITFARPDTEAAWDEAAEAGDLVTRRVVEVDDGAVVTRADAASSVDPWTLVPDDGGLTRTLLHVPYVGFPLLGLATSGAWAVFAVLAVLAVALWVGPELVARARRSGTGHTPG